MLTLLLTTDLLVSSAVQSTAEAEGVQLAVVSSTEELVAQVAAQDTHLVILDLSTAGVDPLQLVGQLRQGASAPGSIIGFAPHVHAAKLAAAEKAGCDEVLSRGQFHGQCGVMLRKYASG